MKTAPGHLEYRQQDIRWYVAVMSLLEDLH